MTSVPEKGDVIDGCYEIEDEIGRGGYAIVFRATDLDHGTREIALKYPNYLNPDVDNTEPRFNREGEILRDIEDKGGHDHVVTFYDHFEFDDTPYIAVELVEGETLEDFDQFGGADMVRSMGIELCDVFSFVHDQEYMYRDHSPDNFMLDANRKLKLIDFNNARPQIACGNCGYDQLDPDNNGDCPTCGTTINRGTLVHAGGGGRYTPPEQIEAGLPQGPWSDVYGIGKILVYLLDGNTYADDGINPHDYRIDCPDYLAEIVERATAYDPSERYSNADQLKRALEERDSDPPIATAEASIEVLDSGGPSIEIESGDTVGRKSRKGPFPKIELDTERRWVSRVHLKFIDTGDGDWKVRDVSSNGTCINPNSTGNEAIIKGPDAVDADADKYDQEHRISDGDTMALGRRETDRTVVLRFQRGH